MKAPLLTGIFCIATFLLFVGSASGELVGITELAPMNEGRSASGVVADLEGRIYVFAGGGAPYPPGIIASVECYDPTTNSWTFREPTPAPRYDVYAATAPNGKMYTFAGHDTGNGSAEVWEYDSVTDTWDTSIPAMPMPERNPVAVAAPDGIIYLFGGAVQAFDSSTMTWEMKTSMPTGREAPGGALGPDGKIYVVGGSTGTDVLEVYDPSNDTWETRSPMPTGRGYLAAGFGSDGKLYAIGGWIYGTDSFFDVIEAYDPHTNTWEFAGTLPIGLGRISGSVVCDESGDIHILGGDTGGTPATSYTTYHFLLTISAPPSAVCGLDQVVHDVVTLDGSGSYVSDGYIVSYDWTLQHRINPANNRDASGVNPTITDLSPGFYDVCLTVTDDGGAMDSDCCLLAAAGSCFCTTSTMHIESILAGTNKGKYGRVTVTVYDDCGNPVPDAEVTGTFSGDFNETGSNVTDTNGVAVIYTTVGVKKPSYTFCVDDVVKGTFPYEPNDNVETCESK